MTKIYTDTIEPASGTTLTIGESGQNTVLAGNDLRANVLQDAGGNAIFTSNGSGVLSGVNSSFGSPLVLIQSQTASATTSFEFTSGITSDYKSLLFTVLAIRVTDDAYAHLQFQVSSDGGSSYGKTATTGMWRGYTNSSNAYYGNTDNTVAQYNSTNFMSIAEGFGGESSDEASYCEIRIWNPASTTYTKSWSGAAVRRNNTGTSIVQGYVGGWIDTTDAINAVKWQFSASTMASGKIKMYGIK